MAQTTISVRMDDDLKQSFDSICDKLGITMSTAVVILAKKMTREQRLPFDLAIDPFYSDSNMNALKAAIADTRPPVIKTMAELEAMEND